MDSVELSYSATTATLWAVSVGGISLSVIGAHFIEKWAVRHKVAHRGLAQTLRARFERLYDPKSLYKLHGEDDEDMIPLIIDGAIFQTINVSVGSEHWALRAPSGRRPPTFQLAMDAMHCDVGSFSVSLKLSFAVFIGRHLDLQGI